jgi:hypothetical protein
MPRLIVAVLLLLVPAACATGSVPPEKLSRIKTVGLVSALENDFTFKTVGFTVFGNDERKVPIDEPLGVDDSVLEQLTQMLGKRYDVRPVTYRKAAVIPGDVAKALRDVSPQGLDAYVVVVPASSGFGNTNQSVSGLGIVDGGSFTSRRQLHALYAVDVFDGHSYELIGAARAPIKDGSLLPAIRGPAMLLSTDFPSQIDRMSAMPDLQRKMLGGYLKSLAAGGMPATLHELRLID